jgi:hypothetical protein
MANEIEIAFRVFIDGEEYPQALAYRIPREYPDIDEWIETTIDDNIPNVESIDIDHDAGVIHVKLNEGVAIEGMIDIPEFSVGFRGQEIVIEFYTEIVEQYNGYVLGYGALEKEYLKAVISNNIPEFRRVLRERVDRNITTLDGENALWIAAKRGYTDLARMLIGVHVDLNFPAHGQGNTTPLMIAAQLGREAIAVLLLNAGADMAAADSNGRTALHIAAAAGQMQIVRLLLARGAIPDELLLEDIQQGKLPAKVAAVVLGVKIPTLGVRETALPNTAFDPINAANMPLRNARNDPTRIVFVIQDSDGKTQYAGSLTQDSLDHYLDSDSHCVFRCRPEVPEHAANIRMNNVFPTAYRRIDLSSRLYIEDTYAGAIEPGTYVLRPVEPMGRIVSKSILNGENVVGGLKCADDGTYLYSISKLSLSVTGGKRQTRASKVRRVSTRKRHGKN